MLEIDLASGITGMILILFAFLMDQTHRWNSDSLLFDLLNFVGASLLAYYAVVIVSWPFLILQLVWALFSFKDVIKDLNRVKKKKQKKIKKINRRKIKKN